MREILDLRSSLSGSIGWGCAERWEKMFPNEKEEKKIIWEIRGVIGSGVFWELSDSNFCVLFNFKKSCWHGSWLIDDMETLRGNLGRENVNKT